MAKKYYKVVTRSLRSARCGGVQYKVGEFVDASSGHFPNSRLFLFTDLEEAKDFADSYEQIYEAHAIGVTSTIQPATLYNDIVDMWSSVASFFKKHKKFKSHFDTHKFNSCVTAKKVKLVKLVCVK